jgi:hypothetical protein
MRQAGFSPRRLALAIMATTTELLRHLVPKRRLRANPRVVKRKMSNFGVKRAAHRCWPQPTRPATRRSSWCRPPGPSGPADHHQRPTAHPPHPSLKSAVLRLKRFARSGDMIGPVLAAWPDVTNRLPSQRPRSARPPGLRPGPHAGRRAVCRRPLPSPGRLPARRRPPERQSLARLLAGGRPGRAAQRRPHRGRPRACRMPTLPPSTRPPPGCPRPRLRHRPLGACPHHQRGRAGFMRELRNTRVS